jgi:4-hydroxybenzoate polyprenyltransferase
LILLMRPHQWVKNGFIVAPLFFTPNAITTANLIAVAMGVLAFCALSSAVYILNDWMDRDADRKHPDKKHRPLAAGTVSPTAAAILAAILVTAALALSLTLPGRFMIVAGVYFAVNLAYSLKLKQVSLIDVMLVALGFVLRVEAGAALIRVEPSVWILTCTGLLALFLALAKRRDDLVKRLDGTHRTALAGYNKPFIDASITAVVGGLLVSYLIYTTTASAQSPHLYVTAPFVVAGVLRYLQITLVEERSGSPTALALTDRFLIVTMIGWIATYGYLLYG